VRPDLVVLASPVLDVDAGFWAVSKRGRSRPTRARIEPRANRIDHHRGERDLLIEGVLPNALVKIDWETDEKNRSAMFATLPSERPKVQSFRATSRPIMAQRLRLRKK